MFRKQTITKQFAYYGVIGSGADRIVKQKNQETNDKI